ncbi:hypothetical protein OPV22_025087 [Ensete ventricosum]|uniref:PCI domain-containing protein n=1 Tax=Ensete ventricosum TaxID=4639 RepID=A0AAV8Q2V9_ENSVE|nr:hypothetical protein OPV22_025087 [Ensete ventricosum]
MTGALQYLETQRHEQPELADWYSAFADLYQRKLWHQLTLKLEQFVRLAVVQGGDSLIQLYHNFIAEFETKISLLKFAHFAVVVSHQYSEKQAAISYLDGIIEKLCATRDLRNEETIVYVNMQIAEINLEIGNQKECKRLLEQGKTTLDSMTDIDPSVHAKYYWMSSQYHKSRQEFAEFYKSTLLHLAYTTVETLSESFKLDLAFDLSLSALLGDNIYNFGELLAHPIINSLIGTNVEWLYHILHAFNTGNLLRYQELCRVHNIALRAQPALVENEKKLLEKINILCLMEIISSRPSEDRTIPLSVIAERTKLSIEDVEYLLMKSLSVHLIEGIIDQVEGTVHVSWVQPRVLGIPQIRSLRGRLDTWVGKVRAALFLFASSAFAVGQERSFWFIAPPRKHKAKTELHHFYSLPILVRIQEMVVGLLNANPTVYKKKERRARNVPTIIDEYAVEPIDEQEIFDYIRDIKDPEHPYSLEELKVVTEDSIEATDKQSYVRVTFTPTIEHCSMATLIGLCLRVKLMRSLPSRYKVDIRVAPGRHATEAEVNKQLNDKERVAAALENPNLLELVDSCLEPTYA